MAWVANLDTNNLGDGVAGLHSLAFGILETVVGAAGIVLGLLGRMNRASMLIAAGLLVIGVSRLIPNIQRLYLPEIGGLIIVLGIGMTMGMLRRGRGGPGKRR